MRQPWCLLLPDGIIFAPIKAVSQIVLSSGFTVWCIDWSGCMPRFVARFFKDVLGEAGRVDEICQCTVELDASNERQATEFAKQKFCDLHGLHDWTLHADRFEVKPADFPS